MGTKEVIARRAEIAHAFSMLMLDPDFMDQFEAYDAVDSDGDVPVIVAAPDESAIITLHRFERVHAASVLLVTEFDENIYVLQMHHVASSGDQATVDLVSGQTVREWIELMRSRPGLAYSANGSDIMPQRADAFAVSASCH